MADGTLQLTVKQKVRTRHRHHHTAPHSTTQEQGSLLPKAQLTPINTPILPIMLHTRTKKMDFHDYHRRWPMESRAPICICFSIINLHSRYLPFAVEQSPPLCTLLASSGSSPAQAPALSVYQWWTGDWQCWIELPALDHLPCTTSTDATGTMREYARGEGS